jgi:hypothetical protein
MNEIPNIPTAEHVSQFQNPAEKRKLRQIVEHRIEHNGIDDGQPFELDEMTNERHQIVDGHLASSEGNRTNAIPHLLETHRELLIGEAMDWCCTEAELLKVGEGREMEMMLSEFA